MQHVINNANLMTVECTLGLIGGTASVLVYLLFFILDIGPREAPL